MANLMLVSEVITAAFTRKVDTAQIKESDVAMAEFKYIRAILTENLYNEVVANTSPYTTLITDYIKPCLAYYTKFLVFNDFFAEVSDRGINQLLSTNAQPVSSQTRTDIREDVLNKANILATKLEDYIQTRYYAGDTLYTKYGQTTNVYNEQRFIGGFLCEDDNINEQYKDDYRRFK